MYIELHAASAFSFLDGASLPEALVERAVDLGYPALALLDRDGVYGAPRFHLAAKRAGIRAIIGAELTIASSRHSHGAVRGSKPRNNGGGGGGPRPPPTPGPRTPNPDPRPANRESRTPTRGC